MKVKHTNKNGRKIVLSSPIPSYLSYQFDGLFYGWSILSKVSQSSFVCEYRKILLSTFTDNSITGSVRLVTKIHGCIVMKLH